MPKKEVVKPKGETMLLVDFCTYIILDEIIERWCQRTEKEELARTFNTEDFVSDIMRWRTDQATKLEIVRRLRAMMASGLGGDT